MNQILLDINICTLAPWQLLLGLLLPFVLGYLLRRFIDDKYVSGYNNLTVENASLKEEVHKTHSYKTSLTSKEKELKDVHHEISVFEKKNTALHGELDKALLSLKSFDGVNVVALRSQISELQDVNNKLQADMQELTGAKSSLEDTAASMTSLKERFGSMLDENIKLKADLRAAIEAKNSVVRSEDNVRKMKEEIRDMSGKIGGFTVEKERLQKEAADAKAALTSTSTDVDTAKAAADSAKSELSALTQRLQKAEEDLAALRLSASEKERELSAIRNKYNAAEADFNGARTNMNELEMKVGGLNSDVQTLRQKMATSDEEKISLQKELDACKAANSSGADMSSEISKLKNKIIKLENENSGFKAAAVVIPPIPTPAAVNDDLKLVEGIGPKIEEIFNNAGIITFRQLAGTPYEKLKTLLDAEGPRYQMHDPYTWPRQAGLLADNNMDELKKYQDYLIAGVDPERIKPVDEAPVKKDDLTIVEGIGPKINELFNEAGIYTFAQLAATTMDKLKAILDAAGPSYQMHDPGTWPEQAKLAADGKFDELQTLKDSLKGGKAE